MDSGGASVTRGYGLLESLLARQRAKMAEKLIPHQLRNGLIADIGCGNHPVFLLNTKFKEKIGVDKISNDSYFIRRLDEEIKIVSHDIELDPELPLPENSCNVVTMLAVIEHLEPAFVPLTLRSIFTSLKNGGVVIITTPAPWTDRLLRNMARARLVSKTEIDEHKATYSPSSIRRVLVQAGFDERNIRSGFFELGLNLWVKARSK